MPLDVEALLAQVSWVRSLARRLVRDAVEAEDVAQDALVVALRGSGQGPRTSRAWLGAVVRNLGRNARRRAGARAGQAAPDGEPTIPSTAELAERAATQRALVEELLELAEAERSVLLLRYFQDLSNEAIARHLGIPASTVASRLARAHEKLRTRWRERHGEPLGGWTALATLAAAPGGMPAGVVPHAGDPLPGAGAAGASGAARSALVALQVAGVAGVIGAVALGARWLAADDPPRSATSPVSGEAGVASARAEAYVSPDARVQDAAPDEARRAAVAGDRGASDPELREPRAHATALPYGHPPLGTHLVRGRVLDLDGEPLAALEVARVAPFVTAPEAPFARRGVPTDPRAVSGEDGSFALETSPIGWFAVTTPGWTTVLSEEIGRPGDEEAVLVAAPSLPLRGVVVDGRGLAVADAGVEVRIAPGAARASGPSSGEAAPLPLRVETGPDGAFAFEDAPGAGIAVVVHKDGFAPRRLELDATPAARVGLRIVLDETVPAVVGSVVDASGAPVEGARVSLGHRIATTDAAGRFVTDFEPAHAHGHDPVLRAVHPTAGFAETEIELPAPGDPPLEVRLVLDRGSLDIEGHVLDPDGRAVPHVRVIPLEETPLGWNPYDGDRVVPVSVESVLDLHAALTGPEGAFRLAGLARRSYRLQVLDPRRLVAAVGPPVDAGSRGVTLSFDPADHEPLAGRIVDADGVPVPGVRVAASLKSGWSGPGDRSFALEFGASAVTDADGAFDLGEVARTGVSLRLEGDAIVPEVLRPIDDEADRSELAVVVERSADLQLDWGAWVGRADSLRFEAADGAPLGFADRNALGDRPESWLPVGTGRSPVLAVPARAAFLVLTLDEREVARVPLRLEAAAYRLVRL